MLVVAMCGLGDNPCWAGSLADEYAVRRWGMEDGLPEGAITSIQQFPDGFLWLTTPRHVVRFDGETFETYSISAFKSGGSSNIRGMYRGPDGKLWLYGDGGVLCYDSGKWQQVVIAGGELSWAPVVYWVKHAPDGKLWAASERGMCSYSDGCFTLKPLVVQKQEKPFIVSSAVMDSNGDAWLATGDALLQFSNDTYTTVTIPFGPPLLRVNKVLLGREDELFVHGLMRLLHRRSGIWSECEPVRVNDLIQAGPNEYWFGAVESLLRWKDGRLEPFVRNVTDMPTDVQCLFQAADGLIWLGTSSGLYRLSPRLVQMKRVSKTPGKDVITVLAAKKQTELLCGVAGSFSLFSGPPDALQGKPLTHRFDISAIGEAADGTLWIGTRGDHLWRCDKKGLFRQYNFQGERIESRSRYVNCILCARDGRLWVGTRQGVLYLNDSQWLVSPAGPVDAILSLAEDTDGRLWAGTQSRGLWQVSTGGVVRVFDTSNGLPSDTIRLILCDPSGALWLGTPRGLVNVRGGAPVSVLSREQGLPSDDVRQLMDDGKGNLWVGTKKEIYRIAKSECEAVLTGRKTRLTLRVYGSEEGLEAELAGVAGGTPLSACLGDGSLWFSTVDGLAHILPSSVTEEQHLPTVYVEKVKARIMPGADDTMKQETPYWELPLYDPRRIASARQAGVKRLLLPSGSRHIEMRYAVPHYQGSERIRFSSFLEGYEAEWSEATTERMRIYPRLPSGDYRFRMRVGDTSGTWKESEQTIQITIMPSIWETRWFVGLMIVLLVLLSGVSAGLVVRRVQLVRHRRKVQELEWQKSLQEERARIARDLHDDLGSGLTEIGLVSALGKRRADDKQESAKKFAEIGERTHELVEALDEIVWAVNPKHDTLASLSSYLVAYSERMLSLSSVQLRLDMDDAMADIAVSFKTRHAVFLAFREAIQNIVKHAAAREVWLRMKATEEGLVIVLEDDGCGYAEGSGDEQSDGVVNMRRRLEDIQGAFSIARRKEGGTRVSFCFPLRKRGAL